MAKTSKASASSRPETSQPESFEAASTELENIVTAMEAGQMPLEASLAAYKRGVELLQYCQKQLQDAQQQVRILEDDLLKNYTTPEIHDR
ncbi:exodeoxyribonuclease VII small subunit [Nitrosomonas sp. Nm51]|uniref:exodeoxyribonuclease VII small subunit n=1 Tax=Nitrosomonas sp. Nm51 TaxID=133720 RepID=UPI0008CE2380|nr:exodeoxyribonuclease VII small subunit [Nitrosomonas sp. Nm51]SER37852.1 exodeoxyribonuclease VII small subunit [Nitrosomonas sp. Nm51]